MAGLRRGAGPLKLDFGAAVAALSSSTSVSEREEYARAVGVIAQSPSHAEALREAGAPAAVAALLRDDATAVAAATALRHLSCANDGNRNLAREAGAIPQLVAMLERAVDAAAVGAAAAALRNLSVSEPREPAADPRQRRAARAAPPRRQRRAAGAAARRRERPRRRLLRRRRLGESGRG